MICQHLEFPFVKRFKARRPRPRSKRKAKHMSDVQRQAIRSKSTRQILRIVENVAASRQVEWQAMFRKDRGSNQVSAARVFAMGLCCAMEVPQFIVARAFGRDWASVFSAEKRCSKLYRESATFRREWDALYNQSAP